MIILREFDILEDADKPFKYDKLEDYMNKGGCHFIAFEI